MRDKMELVELIKSQLKAIVSGKEAAVEAAKFLEVKAGDLMITSPDDSLAIGSEVYSIDADGNNVPLADNEYILDSGEKIVVSGGKISAIAAAEAPVAEEPMAEEAPEEVETPESEAPENEEVPEEDKPADAEEKMAELMARIVKCEELIAELSKGSEKMAAEFSKIAEQPAVEPIRVEPSEFKSVEDKKSSAGIPDIASIREMARRNR